ncbi:MAG: hypothetical protein ACI8X5_002700 [Planctomycetota bacterium]|jgi:hypothetical protein
MANRSPHREGDAVHRYVPEQESTQTPRSGSIIMKLQNTIGGLGLGFALLFVLATCSENTLGPEEAVVDSAPAEIAVLAGLESDGPKMETVVSRSESRWDTVTAGDWIQAFEFQDPRAKTIQPIGTYLQGKEHHEYRNPSKPHMIGSEGDLVYLELAVLWEPHHPILGTVSNSPQNLTQELHMVETWRWVDGDWFFVTNERQGEFHEAHPEIRANKTAKKGK